MKYGETAPRIMNIESKVYARNGAAKRTPNLRSW